MSESLNHSLNQNRKPDTVTVCYSGMQDCYGQFNVSCFVLFFHYKRALVTVTTIQGVMSVSIVVRVLSCPFPAFKDKDVDVDCSIIW